MATKVKGCAKLWQLYGVIKSVPFLTNFTSSIRKWPQVAFSGENTPPSPGTSIHSSMCGIVHDSCLAVELRLRYSKKIERFYPL